MSTAIDQSLHDEVLPELEPGEGLLWSGCPDPMRSARAKIGQMLFGAVFILFLFLVYLSGLPASGNHMVSASMSFIIRREILFIALLLTLCGVLLPVFSYRTAQRTVYAVTDRRVLSLTRGRSAKVVRYDDIQVPLLDLRADGSGDIHFQGKFRDDGTECRLLFPRFLGVEAAEHVYQLLLARMPGANDGRSASRAVQDYLELLVQGKRTLDDDPSGNEE